MSRHINNISGQQHLKVYAMCVKVRRVELSTSDIFRNNLYSLIMRVRRASADEYGNKGGSALPIDARNDQAARVVGLVRLHIVTVLYDVRP